MATAFATLADEPFADIEAYLEAQQRKSLLRLLTCGSVDDGKSTLLGRLLHDSKTLLEDQLETLESDSKRSGTQGEGLDFALLVDGLAAEREQGITIDVAYRFFATDKRKFIVADTPGHVQYTRNMVTGASTADLAIILIDARKGVLTQSKRHSTLVHLLGIKSLVLAVNKMDMIGFDRSAYDAILADYRAFADEIGIVEFTPIPMSALTGDNIATKSAAMPWYKGPTLLDHLERVPVGISQPEASGFQLPVQWVNRPNSGFRGYAGRIAGGSIHPGDAVKVLPSGKRSTVDRIVTFGGDLEQAVEGQSVTLTLADEVDCSRGEVIVADASPLAVADRLAANFVWMADEPYEAGKSYWLKLGTSTVSATVTHIDHLLDVDSGRPAPAKPLGLNDIGQVELHLDRAIPAAAYAHSRELGAFILIDKLARTTVAAGMIDGFPGARDGDHDAEATRIHWANDAATAERARHRLQQMGRPAFVLDDEALREFDEGERADYTRRARAAAVLLARAGVNVVVAIDVPAAEQWPGQPWNEASGEGNDEWVI